MMIAVVWRIATSTCVCTAALLFVQDKHIKQFTSQTVRGAFDEIILEEVSEDEGGTNTILFGCECL